MTTADKKSLIDSFRCTGNAHPDVHRINIYETACAEIDVVELKSFKYDVGSLSITATCVPLMMKTSRGEEPLDKQDGYGSGKRIFSPPYSGRLVFYMNASFSESSANQLSEFDAAAWETP